MIMEDTKLRCTPCTNDMDNIPLDDPVQQAPLPVNADPVVLLAREWQIHDSLKSYCLMAGDSKKLD